MSSPSDNRGLKDQATSFRRFAEHLKEQSKEMFLRDGHHAEIFFLIDGDGGTTIIPTPADVDRDQMLAGLKRRIRECDSYGVVHISESWSYFCRRRGDHILKQIAEGEIKVSELRPEDRDEVLVVMMESREGDHFMWITPILRDGDAVTLGETLAFPEQSAGRFAGLFES
jgi:hypothetical protein